MRFRVSRVCACCGSTDLRIREVIPGEYWRKECADCGSTGPFSPDGGRADSQTGSHPAGLVRVQADPSADRPNCAVPSCPNNGRYYGYCQPHYLERAAEFATRPTLSSRKGLESSA